MVVGLALDHVKLLLFDSQVQALGVQRNHEPKALVVQLKSDRERKTQYLGGLQVLFHTGGASQTLPQFGS
jgi:hypothetical protein